MGIALGAVLVAVACGAPGAVQTATHPSPEPAVAAADVAAPDRGASVPPAPDAGPPGPGAPRLAAADVLAPVASGPATSPPAPVGPAQAAPPGTLDQVMARLLPAGGTKLLVGNVEFRGHVVAGTLAGHLGARLAAAASRLPGTELVAGKDRDRLLAYHAETSGDSVDPESAPKLGLIAGAQHVLECEYDEYPTHLLLFLRLKDTTTGIGPTVECEIPRASLPPGLSSTPSNEDRIRAQRERWQAEFPSRAFVIDLWTDRGVNGAYLPDEKLVLSVRSQRPGQLVLEHLDAQGRVSVLFPNDFSEGGRVRADRVLQVPDDSMFFDIEIDDTPGNGIVRAVVTADDGTRAQAFCGYLTESRPAGR